jgi:hypothetical protein
MLLAINTFETPRTGYASTKKKRIGVFLLSDLNAMAFYYLLQPFSS